MSQMHSQQHQQQSSYNNPFAQNGSSSHYGGNNYGYLPWGAPFPSLHMWPLQDTFGFKMIHLPPGQRVSPRLDSSRTADLWLNRSRLVDKRIIRLYRMNGMLFSIQKSYREHMRRSGNKVER